eukprot:s2303_g2.t1
MVLGIDSTQINSDIKPKESLHTQYRNQTHLRPQTVLLFRCFFGNLDAYPVHPLTQASWCFVELDALNLAKDLCPDLPSDESTQGFPEGRFAMRRVFERLEDLNARNAFTPTQRCHVQQLIRAYRYRFELDYGLMPQKVKSFCKSQFDISNSVVSSVAWS